MYAHFYREAQRTPPAITFRDEDEVRVQKSERGEVRDMLSKSYQKRISPKSIGKK